MSILIQTWVIKHIHDSTMNLWLVIGTISNFEDDFGWQFADAPYKFELLLKHSKKFPLVFGGLIIHEYPSYRRRDFMPISRHKNLHPHTLWPTYVSVHDNVHLLLNYVFTRGGEHSQIVEMWGQILVIGPLFWYCPGHIWSLPYTKEMQ